MKFIPIDKMKKLREASSGGDERARKILRAQAYNEDFDADLEDYFKPVQDISSKEEAVDVFAPDSSSSIIHKKSSPAASLPPMPKVDLATFLANSGVTEGDPEYEETVAEYKEMYPDHPVEGHANTAEEEMDLTKDIAQGIIDLISKCDQTALSLMQNDDVDDTTKKGAMVSIQEIKQNLLESADKIKKVKNSFCKKNKNDLE